MKTGLQTSLAIIVALSAPAAAFDSAALLDKISAIGGQLAPGLTVPAPVPMPAVAAPASKAPSAPVGALSGRFSVAPDFRLTPGVLCTPADKDFQEYRYGERIPYCRRNFTTAEKKEVSRWYGIAWEDHGLYQYDHLLSLCLGGSNALTNVWPMLWDEARKKAGMEAALCRRLERGEVTQAQAVREELSWFEENILQAPGRVLGLDEDGGRLQP